MAPMIISANMTGFISARMDQSIPDTMYFESMKLILFFSETKIVLYTLQQIYNLVKYKYKVEFVLNH